MPRSVFLVTLPVTLATVAGIALVDRLAVVPNPGVIFSELVVFASYIGGMGPGLVSAAVAFALCVPHFSPAGDLLKIQPEEWPRLLVLGITFPLIVIMVGLLRRSEHKARAIIESKTQRLTAL